jgi:RNA polymerase sigma-70 factor, ECF subfamily
VRDAGPLADAQLERHEARAALEEVLDELEMDLRAVLVLFELEEMSTAEIAATLEIPMGTVSSRLRRAREEFQSAAKRVHARVWTAARGATREGGER